MRPVTVLFACYVMAVIADPGIGRFAAVGSAVSLACAIAVLVRIYKGRAGPASVRATALFFTIPLVLFGATLRFKSVTELSTLKESLLNLTNSTECSFDGMITDISLDKEKTVYYMEDATVTEFENTVHGSVRVTVKSEYDTNIHVGDKASGHGKIRAPQPLYNPGGFDEKLYYEVRGTDALITADFFEKAGEVGRISLKRILTDLRIKTVNALSESLGDDEAGVLAAMLAGERGLLDDETKDSLAAGGIAHILAVSGLHISLIAGGIYTLLMKLFARKALSSVITIVFLLLYGVFTGMPVSAMRAVIMSSCMLLARATGKTYDMISALSVAGLLILILNPLYVRDSSFIMSFCAAMGVAWAREIICGARIKKKWAVSLMSVAGIYLFLMPVLINTYYYITPYSVLINLIVIPFMSLLVPFGGICVASMALFGSGISRFAGGICHYMIRSVIGLSDLIAGLPYSKLIVGHTEETVLIVYYAVLFAVLILVMSFRKKTPIWALVLCITVFVRIDGAETTVHMLDVGQGECILIEEGDENIIVDAGSTNVKNLYKYRIGPFLRYMGIDRIDRLILTHSDSDHMNAMEDLIADPNIDVKELVCSDNNESGYEEDCVSLGCNNIREVSAGDEISLENGSRIHVVSPKRNAGSEGAKGNYGKVSDKNDESVVFELETENVRALFTGDSSSKKEAEYVSMIKEQDLLKVAHHGSKYSTSETLLEKVRPTVGIVSASATNRYGHPSAETLKRLTEKGCTVFATPSSGYIRISCNKGELRVFTIRQNMKFDTDI
ncbi:MAG: DNA internalization-related competence protein ComEC/Rec2 [Lachnospiraceae bacterium]|nr:DNA internalization-related competence protein ComEC/Rec2 [Lachnospiraceae bacterium]